jgi:hypothetical protein
MIVSSRYRANPYLFQLHRELTPMPLPLFTGSPQQDLDTLLTIMEKGDPLSHLPDTHPARQVLKAAAHIHDLGFTRALPTQQKFISDYQTQSDIPADINNAILEYQAKYYAPEVTQSAPAHSHVAAHRPEGKRPHHHHDGERSPSVRGT